MKKKTITDEVLISKVLHIRGQKVMIDRDLAELYGTTTVKLNQQVKRNIKRFPTDFMFQLTESEKTEVITNCDNLKSLKFSPHLPYVFKEHGAVMLASVLNSQKAIDVNIQIVRVFIKMREVLMTNKNLLLKVERIEKKLLMNDEKMSKHENEIQTIIRTLKTLLKTPTERQKVGYKRSNE